VAERLYYDNAALEFRAIVTDIRLDSTMAGEQVWQIALDRTAFYPQGGGQPFDTGLLVATAKSGAVLEVAVERVEEDEAAEVWHYVRKPLPEGTEVVGRVGGERRMDHAQQHSGQHLLSAVFLAELGARTVSFHLGADNVTLDLALREAATPLTEADLAGVQATANRLIYENRSITARWVLRDEAEAMLARGELGKLPERDGPMRIVEMAGVEFNACGGTHVGSTGAIGGVTLRRLEKAKQNWRVEFCCGLRAACGARVDFLRLRELGSLLSVGPADLAARVAGLIEDKKAAAKELKALQRKQATVETPKSVLET
jgi:alanyl-tRNA synthetase